MRFCRREALRASEWVRINFHASLREPRNMFVQVQVNARFLELWEKSGLGVCVCYSVYMVHVCSAAEIFLLPMQSSNRTESSLPWNVAATMKHVIKWIYFVHSNFNGLSRLQKFQLCESWHQSSLDWLDNILLAYNNSLNECKYYLCSWNPKRFFT